jgi:hypothetical protein
MPHTDCLWLLRHCIHLPRLHDQLLFWNTLRTRDRSRIDKIGLLDDWRRLFNPLAEDVSLEEVRKPHRQLIVEETLGWDREDLCEKH